MEFGIFILMQQRNKHKSSLQILRDAVEQTRLVGGLGLGAAWYAERHFSKHGRCSSPLTLFVRCPAFTRRIRLDTCIVVAPLYQLGAPDHPGRPPGRQRPGQGAYWPAARGAAPASSGMVMAFEVRDFDAALFGPRAAADQARGPVCRYVRQDMATRQCLANAARLKLE